MDWPRGGSQTAKSRALGRQNSLSDRVVMIATDTSGYVPFEPMNARDRVRGVVDGIPHKKAGIEHLVDGGQSGPIGMNVGNDEDSHRLIDALKAAVTIRYRCLGCGEQVS